MVRDYSFSRFELCYYCIICICGWVVVCLTILLLINEHIHIPEDYAVQIKVASHYITDLFNFILAAFKPYPNWELEI